MKSEATVIVGVIMAILSLLNIVLTPEDMQAIQVIVEAVILAGGVTAIRRWVASYNTVEKITSDTTAKVVFHKS
jgi:hypothetical protein